MPTESPALKQMKKEISAQDERWFYKKRKSQVGYNNNGKGSLSIPRLIQAKACFKKAEPVSSQTPKTLILSDWNAAGWNALQLIEMNKMLSDLLKQGFNIQVWQEGQLVPLKGTLTEAQRKKITPVSSQTLIQHAAKKNLPIDQLHILDNQEINRLMDGKDKTEPQVKLSHFFNSPHNKTELIKVVKQKPLKEIIFDINSTKAGDLLDDFLAEALIDPLELEPIYEHIEIVQTTSADKLTEILTESASSIKSVHINTPREALSELRSIRLPALEELDLTRSAYSVETIKTLLENNTSNLKILNLSFAAHKKEELTKLLCQTSFPSLEELNLDGFEPTWKELTTILANAPNLKSLNLKMLQFPKQGIDVPKQAALPVELSLESLDLEHSNITAESISMLMSSSASSLKKLNLNQCRQISAVLSQQIPLPSLEELRAAGTDLSSETLNVLLTGSSKLKVLDLSWCSYISDLIDEVSLPSLEELNLHKSTISGPNIYNLLHLNAQNLKILNLAGCIHVSKARLSELPLCSLEQLDLSGTGASNDDLEKLLTNNASTLKKLNLGYCRFSSLDSLFSKIILNSLEELDLSGSHISSEVLNQLLQRNQKLKVLNLNGCTNIAEKLERVSLDSLEELRLGRSTISNLSLQNLLRDAKNLQSLDLKDCTFPETIAPVSLPSLELLDLEFSRISVQSVYNLLINTNPKHLDVVSLPNRPEFREENLPADLKHLLQRIPQVQYAHPPNPWDEPAAAPEDSPPTFTAASEAANTPKTWDADTQPSSESLPAKIHFFSLKGPQTEETYPVNYYRLNAYNKLTVADQCTLQDAFTLDNEGDLQLVACEAHSVSLTEFNQLEQRAKRKLSPPVLGVHELIISEEWTALPSLQAGEKITDFCIDRANLPIEIQYSERDNLYYVRSEQKALVHLKFLVELPQQESQALPKKIEKLKNKYLNYTEGPLELKEGPLTGKDYLHALQTQNKGACRHRAVAFMAELEAKYPCRIISNEVHALVEVYCNNQWVSCDLGGYAADIQLDHSLEETPQDQVRPALAAVIAQSVEPGLESPQPADFFAGIAVVPELLKRFATWDTIAVEKPGLKEFCQKQLQNDQQKKKLIELDSDEESQALLSALNEHCKHISRPVFCINSLDDFICSAPSMQITDPLQLKGALIKGPGGPLYEFLKASYSKDNPPVLLVNLNQKELVLFNALLDAQRKADGIDVPESALIIGVLNTQKTQYGSDFSSRFDEKTHSPLETEALRPFIPKPIEEFKDQKDTVSINLFHSSEWKERLTGRWVMKETGPVFEEGLLIKAIRTQKTIVIENAPWSDPQFQLFIQNLELTGSVPRPLGAPELGHPIPPLLSREGYDWQALTQKVHCDTAFQSQANTLNPTQLNLLFQRYELDGKKLKTIAGWMQQHASKVPKTPLHLNLTRDLSEDAWAECLSQAQDLGLELHLHCAPDISLPSFLQSKLSPGAPADTRPWPDRSLSSTDPDTTVAALCAAQKSLVFDISECDESDLLLQITGALNQKTLDFEFNSREGALLQALKEGKTVILKGSFSEELQDALADFVLQRRAANNPLGQVLLVSKEPLYHFMPAEHQVISAQDKLKYLLPLHPDAATVLSTEQLESEPLTKLKARVLYVKNNPGQSSDKAWEGLDHLPPAFELKSLDLTKSKIQAAAFTQKRLNAVEAVLKYQPFVFLSGLTGVGKTTFVTQHLVKDGHLYQDESQLKAWAMNQDPKQKILFIDEANLSAKLWSEMEGLFQDPPGILIEGVYYPLDEHHKVVFAGNPISYGDDRSLAPFFANHGNAVVFEPLSLAVIYEDLLGPLWASDPELASQAPKLSKPILKAYQFLCDHSTQEVLISPRELQMMALMTLAYCKEYPGANAEQAADYYAYQIAQSLVPEAHQAAFRASFNKPQELARAPVPVTTGFLITPSRTGIQNLLEDQLMLRKFKRESTQKVQQYGGLGGMVIEGEPGVGKSELVTAVLIQNGYQEVHAPYTQEQVPEQAFYRMPPSMGLEEKEQLLLKAFHEGSVVVIDEINSAPMMERLLNSLLMGSTPEGEKAQNPGFMIIGTQNPISMAGRIAASTALSRRLIKADLPPYEPREMVAILQKKGLEEVQAKELVLAYLTQRQEAKDKALSPEPCFRDLLRAADEQLTADKKLQAANENQFQSKLDPAAAKKTSYSFLFKAAAVTAGLALLPCLVVLLAVALVLKAISSVVNQSLSPVPRSFDFFKSALKQQKPQENLEEVTMNKPGAQSL